MRSTGCGAGGEGATGASSAGSPAGGRRGLLAQGIVRAESNASAGEYDQALFAHLAHSVMRAFLGVPRRLDAAVGHLVGAERGRLVDRDAAELEGVRGRQRR